MDRPNGAAAPEAVSQGDPAVREAAPIADEVPRHVGLIPDGNRRWACQHGVSTIEGHRAGSRAIDRFIEICRARGIAFVTIWPFSQRNMGRTRDEVGGLLALLGDYIAARRSVYRAHRIRFRMIGDVEGLRDSHSSLIDTLMAVQAETASHDAITLTMALNYGGRDKIVRAAQRLIQAGVAADALDETLFARHLDAADQPPPDLILRTGGDRRLSGFLTFQAEYAELRFTSTLLPDLEDAEIEALLTSHGQRRYSQ